MVIIQIENLNDARSEATMKYDSGGLLVLSSIQDEHRKELGQGLPHKRAYLMSSKEQAEFSKHFDAKDLLVAGSSNHSTIFLGHFDCNSKQIIRNRMN